MKDELTRHQAFQQYMRQHTLISDRLKLDPDVWLPRLRGVPEESKLGNWYVSFVPRSWGQWKGAANGVHFEFAYGRRTSTRSECMRLTIGVEKPLKDQYKQEFKEAVKSRAESAGVVPRGYALATRSRTKLLEADPIPFNDNSWEIALERYRSLQPLNRLIAELVREYHHRDAFSAEITFE